MERRVFIVLITFSVIEKCKSYTKDFNRGHYYIQRSGVQQKESTPIGNMSIIACTGKCSELGGECCKATYIMSTTECRIGLTGCCNTPEESGSGVSVLQQSILVNEEPLQEPLVVLNGVDIGDWHEPEFCHKRHFAIGYRIKVELQDMDYTGTNSIEIICGSRSGYICGDIASSGYGKFDSIERHILCPQNTFLESFNIQVEAFKGLLDNSGTNWIKFKCRNLHTTAGTRIIEADNTDLTHLRGVYGEWSNSCPAGTAICGIQTRVQPAQGIFTDDMALTDTKFFCCH